MIERVIRLGTLFSGIGSIEYALKELGIEYEIEFACDNGEVKLEKEYIDKKLKEEILKDPNLNIDDCIKKIYRNKSAYNYMYETYKENYNIQDDRWYEDVRYLDGYQYRNEIDLLVGGSPCQSFSIIGKRRGFEDVRGTLFYDYVRIIRECLPKVFIFENVKGILNHDHGKTWDTIQNIFNKLNYDIYIDNDIILNSKDYGIPQNRPRLFVIGIRSDIEHDDFVFPEKRELTTNVSDYLENNLEVESKYYLGQKGFEFVTNPNNKNRAQINSNIMQCQKANQQFNWNGEFVFVPYDEIKDSKDILKKAYISKYNGEKGAVRKLTPRECARLMGYKDALFNFPKDIPDQIKYKQAGNSIVTTMFTSILPNLIETGVFDE